MITANQAHLRSWIPVPEHSDFPIQNIPFGIIKLEGKSPRVATRIGDSVIDLFELYKLGYFESLTFDAMDFDASFLNSLMKKGKLAVRELRNSISSLFQSDNSLLRDKMEVHGSFLYSLDSVEMLLPIQIGDYTDFYSSKEHATNVGVMFRDPANALLPNWLWIPVGYHGRASSVVVSGTPFHRPKGQIKPNDDEDPIFSASRQIDFELEMGFVTFDGKALGDSISIAEADDYIFGLCLFNDWSARDIQKWEYVPLGPFLAKNFVSTMSAWIVTLDALQPFRVESPIQSPEVLAYLAGSGKDSYDINLQVAIATESNEETEICQSNFKYMYWTMAQQLAHHTVNGCNVRVGDLMGSGTISGPTEGSYGSMLELAWKGTKPLTLADGSQRRFILDGDTVVMRGYCQNASIRIGFGEVKGKLLPAK
ncbi:MAG: fumarylacetoacetase [Flavobacteriia bacterium]|nr:fumarylacetoacetase [Flavobacteriia bacterium]